MIRVGVLRGGLSDDYETSFKTGDVVLKNLPKEFSGIDILIDREGQWHRNGFPEEPHESIKHVDVIYNALHGEDAKIIKVMEDHKIPFTGSGSYAAALFFARPQARNLVRMLRILVPESILSTEEEMIGKKILIGTIKNFRNQRAYALIPAVVEDGKYNFRYGISVDEKEKLLEAAKTVHEYLNAGHHAEHSFVLKKNGTPYYLSTNTHPKLHSGSFFQQALEQIGSSVPNFIEHVLGLAISKGN